MLAGPDWLGTGAVVTTTSGHYLIAAVACNAFHQTLQDAGLCHQRFYDMRNCGASLLLARFVHPRLVMETLGHSPPGLTMMP